MLQEKAMLVKLSIGVWNAEKKDKTITKEIAATHNSDETMGIYKKHLIIKDALKTIVNIATEARILNYNYTLPWIDGGTRMLPVSTFFKYREEIEKLKTDFQAAVNNFISDYDLIVKESEIKLGDMFDISNYPSKDDLQQKYYFTIQIFPVPSGDDFRVNLSVEETDKIKKSLEENLNEVLNNAIKDVWERLYKVVERFTETLPKYNPNEKGKDKNSFHNSIVTNTIELCELLPKLNITGNKELSKLTKEVEEKLTKYTAKELKEDEAVRKEITNKATEILDAIKPFIN